jgi:hypothetical protein
VHALGDDDTRAKPAAKPVRRQSVDGRRNWTVTAKPSDKNIERVHSVIQASDQPLSVNDVSDALAGVLTKETIGRCIAWLREHERIRIAGRVTTHGGKGHSNVYAVMA